MKWLILLSGILFSTTIMAIENDSGCPEVPELTEFQSERIFLAIARGETVIECRSGQCWDFVTQDPFTYTGIAKDGFYVIYPEPQANPSLFKEFIETTQE